MYNFIIISNIIMTYFSQLNTYTNLWVPPTKLALEFKRYIVLKFYEKKMEFIQFYYLKDDQDFIHFFLKESKTMLCPNHRVKIAKY